MNFRTGAVFLRQFTIVNLYAASRRTSAMTIGPHENAPMAALLLRRRK